MSKSPAQLKAAIRNDLKTGDSDPAFRGWPGSNFLEVAQRGSAMLCDALVAEVASRTQSQRLVPALVDQDVTAMTRNKIGPMVTGLFSAAGQPAVLTMLERSVVFLHPGNIEHMLRSAACPRTAWSLANLYLVSLDCERLSDEAPNIVGLSEETTCYVSPAKCLAMTASTWTSTSTSSMRRSRRATAGSASCSAARHAKANQRPSPMPGGPDLVRIADDAHKT